MTQMQKLIQGLKAYILEQAAVFTEEMKKQKDEFKRMEEKILDHIRKSVAK